ncbi:MAG: hypothetical protein ACRER2_19230 [Methylococcales bacterium]
MPGNPQTIFVYSILIVIACSLLSCATQTAEVKTGPVSIETPEGPEFSEESEFNSVPRSTLKDGRELKLVRIMEGGACNDRNEGVRGFFLVYAQPEQFERVDPKKGHEMSEQFESKVTSLSLEALQEAINTMNIADNPFALDIEDNLQQIIDQLISKFDEFVQPAIEQFESDNDLSIDVIPFPSSMNFMLENCNEVLSGSPISS